MSRRHLSLFALLAAAVLLFNACAAPMDASKSRADAVIRAGNIPPAEELRVAEYLNYYKQDLPAPVNTTLGLDTRLGNALVPATGGDVWLQIGLRARDAETQAVAPLNLALVIDRSGSMSTPDKMQYVKKSLAVFLHSLAPNDLVSIVTYSDNAEVLIPSRPVGDGAWIENAINRITPRGSTNLNAGLVAGLEEVARNFDTRRSNRVILLTDGIANAGETDPVTIANTAKQYNDRGIYLATIGLGQEYNDALLSTLARQGKGGYHFVGSAADMDKIFHQEVSGLIQKAASGVSVTFTPEPGVSVLSLTGYDTTPPAGSLSIKLQDMGTGDTQIVLAHLSLSPGAAGPRTLANVQLQYTDLFSNQPVSLSQPVTANASPASVEPLANTLVFRNVTIQETAQGLKQIDQLYRAERYLDAWNLASQLEYNLRLAAQLTGEAQLSTDADTMHQYEMVLAPYVQQRNGFFPQYTPAAVPNASPLDRMPTFTPAPVQIEIE